ncbi:DUF2141 domain-containing protein [Neolewinella litorea]|uniref:DUF2141 domain-containing protein n=1 Tax=Neolewinella litorea TaxID=2562452 RepID=UPI001B3B4CA6|nr:DUF2141 domain-containing protein [Neolewinella litorea]
MPLLFAIIALLFPFHTPQTVNVEVVSSTAGGEIYLAVYDSADGFENDDHVANARHLMGEEALRAELDLSLPRAGRYVVAAFQDLNGNGLLDRNFLGVPTEPYGFGKLPPSKWRAPSFGELVTHIQGADHLVIEMRHWKDY